MPTVSALEFVAATLFAVAVVHTFSTKVFARLAHGNPAHAGLWHLLGEVEVVFGFWALALVLALFTLSGKSGAVEYLESRNFTEPVFVFVIMVIAASRPILEAVRHFVQSAAKALPGDSRLASYFLLLAAVPLLGSLITEPAAMTLAALMLRDRLVRSTNERFKYATIGVLFVNISIGGTLTAFAAPPILMVANTWGWDSAFVLSAFGWKAAIAVLVNTAMLTWAYRREIEQCTWQSVGEPANVPTVVTATHALFLLGVVAFAHYPVVFVGLFLFFLGYTEAYPKHQSRLMLREGLMVAFFLAGLITLGGLQKWWLQPLLAGMDPPTAFAGATLLTAITDNAALTYLGSLVEGTSPEFKYALVAGAVTGGGLTVIANAPNPAGFSILKGAFRHESIGAAGLFAAALLPTLVAVVAFTLLP